MRVKLQCTLRLKTAVDVLELAQDVNIVEADFNSMSDQAFKAFFDSLRRGMLEKYKDHVLSLIEVDIKELAE